MFAGVDLSSAVVRGVLADAEGHVLARAASDDGAISIAEQAGTVLAELAEAADGQLRGAGIATALPCDELDAELQAAMAPSLPRGILPVVMSAGGALALAEAWTGAAAGVSDVVAFAIGEHVTAGLVSGGRPWRGARGLAGSVGWLALNPVEREDYRRYGGLEAEVSAAGIVRRLVWRVKSGDHSAVVDQVGGDLTRLTAEDVLQGARLGDGVCISVVRDTARYAGMAVANLVAVADPLMVVLGGILAASSDVMLDAVRHETLRRLGPAQGNGLSIVVSTLGADAVALGAAGSSRTGPS